MVFSCSIKILQHYHSGLDVFIAVYYAGSKSSSFLAVHSRSIDSLTAIEANT